MPDDMEDFTFGDDDGDEGDSGDSEVGGGGLKRFLSGTILKVLMYIAAGIGVFIIALFAGKLGGGSSDKDDQYRHDMALMDHRPPALASFELREFRSNTADIDSPGMVMVKLSLGYEKNNLPLQTELNDRRREITDLILLTLNGKYKEDIDTAQKKEDLKEELIKRINGRLQSGRIDDIYYEEFSVN